MTTALSPRIQLILHGSIPTVLLRLAAPNVVSIATMTAVTFADVYYVGQLSTAALASLAIVSPSRPCTSPARAPATWRSP